MTIQDKQSEATTGDGGHQILHQDNGADSYIQG
jgi:hypothetical protein